MKSRPVILCVDDDPDDREMIRDVLQATDPGFKIIEANDGREALDYLQSEEGISHLPSLIILDMNMPRLSGRETLAILKSEPRTEKIPVVVFTTSNSEVDRTFCNRFEAEMITKPPTYKALREVAQRLLQHAATSLSVRN